MQLSDQWNWRLEGLTDYCKKLFPVSTLLGCMCPFTNSLNMFGKSQNKRLSFKELTKKFTIAGYIHMQLSSHGFAYCSEHSFKLNGIMCMLRFICCLTPEKKGDAIRTFNATAICVFHRCVWPLTPTTMPLQSCLRLLCTASIHNRNSFHLIQGCNNKTV